ncbi:MAG: ACT domain-containing protein [Lachnospiraceae bacterium]|nr:ACT domain-containing protein [Lachnospiraceae bacterium]
MSVKQISIFLENKAGRLDEMTKVLADNSVNMRAVSLAETDGFGIVRIIVDDPYAATTVLKDAGYINKLTSVVIVEVPNSPGGLNKVLKVFTDSQINLEYIYALSAGKQPENAYMIFRVSDHKSAEAALVHAGIRVLTQEDIVAL